MLSYNGKFSVYYTVGYDDMIERISIAGVSERDVDLLLLEEFQSSPSFRLWFQGLVLGRDARSLEFVSARRSVIYAAGETDLEVVFADAAGKKIRFLIENKVNAGFQARQAERYRETGNSHVLRDGGTAYHTVLIAPERYFGTDASTRGFDKRLTYETILQWFIQATELGDRRRYKIALLQSAIEKGTLGYQPIEDAPVTDFWRAYWLMAKDHGRELEMVEPITKASRAGFIYFRPREKLPRGFEICHKFKKGIVDLHIKGFGRRLNEVDHALRAHLRHDMRLAAAGISAAIRVEVPRLDPGRPFSDQQLQACAGLEAARGLLRWFIEKQQFMPNPVLQLTRKGARG